MSVGRTWKFIDGAAAARAATSTSWVDLKRQAKKFSASATDSAGFFDDSAAVDLLVDKMVMAAKMGDTQWLASLIRSCPGGGAAAVSADAAGRLLRAGASMGQVGVVAYVLEHFSSPRVVRGVDSSSGSTADRGAGTPARSSAGPWWRRRSALSRRAPRRAWPTGRSAAWWCTTTCDLVKGASS